MEYTLQQIEENIKEYMERDSEDYQLLIAPEQYWDEVADS